MRFLPLWRCVLITILLFNSIKIQSLSISEQRITQKIKCVDDVGVKPFKHWQKLLEKTEWTALSKVNMISCQFEFSSDDLAEVLWSESGFNTKAANSESNARMIWQCVPATLRWINEAYNTSYDFAELQNSSATEQLDVLYLYLKLVSTYGSIRNKHDLKLAFMLPAYLSWSENAVVPDKYYQVNKQLDMNGDAKLSIGEIKYSV